MYQSSSESSIEHGHFPSVINLYAVGENSKTVAQQTVPATIGMGTLTSSSGSSCSSKQSEKSDPFLALVHNTHSSFPQNALNDDEVSYASSSTYSQSPTTQRVSIPSMAPIGFSPRTNHQKQHKPFMSPYSQKHPPDRQGSCGSAPSSDSDSDCPTPRPTRRRNSTTSTSTSSGDDDRIQPFSPNRSNRNTITNCGRNRKALLSHTTNRPILNIVGSPSPSSNTVSSGGSGHGVRHSLVSQYSSITGRLETTLAESIALQVADSGISNTSPETQSSTEFHSNSHRHRSLDTLSSPMLPQVLPNPSALTTTSSNPSMCNPSILKTPKDLATQHNLMQAAFKSSLFSLLSGIYGLLICAWGLLMPVIDLVTSSVSVNLFEAFYIYLYTIGTIFLIYVYLYLAREDKTHGRRQPRTKRRFLLRAFGFQAGSLYLRLGAIGFGIVSMIRDGLTFASIVQHGRLLTECSSVILAVRPLLAIIFTFIQLNFIFLNSKMCIHRYKALARFGLSHMIATNICVWIRVALTEGISDARFYRFGSFNTTSTPTITYTAPNVSHKCTSEVEELLQGLKDNANPYLYPTTIQYSVIAAAIVWMTWRNVGSLKLNQGYSQDSSPDSTLVTAERTASGNQRSHTPKWKSIDCAGSHRGLFLGLAALVAATVSLLSSSVLMSKAQYNRAGVLVSYCGEAVLLTVSLICILVAFARMSDMLYVVERDCQLDTLLHFVTLGGLLFYWATFSLATQNPSAEVVICTIVQLLQACTQAIFISTALKRMSYKALHEREKPGRELVTFLIICNLALLVMAEVEPLRLQHAMKIKTNWSSTFLSLSDHLYRPLCTLYRFHSVVALATVWKDAYKFKSH